MKVKVALNLTLSILLLKSSKIDQNSSHYDYHQRIGRIVEICHYLHFNINITTLLKIFKHIAGTYTILSTHQELKESNLLKQAEILCDEIRQNIQQIINHRTEERKVIKYVFGNPDANDLDKINNYSNSLSNINNMKTYLL